MTSRVTAIMGGLVTVVLIAAVTFLIWQGKSTGDLISLIGIGVMPVLSLTLYGKLNAVQQNTNGTTTGLMTMVTDLQKELSRRPLPPTGNAPEPDKHSPS